jgi:hypothetical protein
MKKLKSYLANNKYVRFNKWFVNLLIFILLQFGFVTTMIKVGPPNLSDWIYFESIYTELLSRGKIHPKDKLKSKK